jgi:hypothetical protein
MRWVEALKIWNGKRGGLWCVPKKGTPEHAEVKKIMGPTKAEMRKAEKEKAKAPKEEETQFQIEEGPEVSAAEVKAEARRQRLEKGRQITKKVRDTMKREKLKEFLRKELAKRKAKKAAPVKEEEEEEEDEEEKNRPHPLFLKPGESIVINEPQYELAFRYYYPQWTEEKVKASATRLKTMGKGTRAMFSRHSGNRILVKPF